MADKEKKRKLLKAKIAVALQDEYKRVPMTEEIDSVFHRIRVMYKAVLGCTTSGLSRRSPDSLPCFNTKTLMLIGYARVSTLDQTLAPPAGRAQRCRLRADLYRHGFWLGDRTPRSHPGTLAPSPRRHLGRLAVGPARPVPGASDRHHPAPTGARRWLPVAAGTAGHHDQWRKVDLSCLRGARRVRAGPHQGANPRRPPGCSSARPAVRQAQGVESSAGQAAAEPCDGWPEHRWGDLRELGDFPGDVLPV